MRKTLLSTILVVGASVVLVVVDAQQPAGPPGKAAPKGGVQGRLTWFDRQGKVAGTSGEPGLYRTLTISPDGKRAAFERADPQTQNRDIWLLDVASGRTTRFTSDPAWEAFPTWSPDGSRIIFTSNRSGVYDLYQKASNGTGTEELLYKSSEGKGPTSWSPDGRYLDLLQPRAANPRKAAGRLWTRGSRSRAGGRSAVHQHHGQILTGWTLDRLYAPTNRARMKFPYARSIPATGTVRRADRSSQRRWKNSSLARRR